MQNELPLALVEEQAESEIAADQSRNHGEAIALMSQAGLTTSGGAGRGEVGLAGLEVGRGIGASLSRVASGDWLR